MYQDLITSRKSSCNFWEKIYSEVYFRSSVLTVNQNTIQVLFGFFLKSAHNFLKSANFFCKLWRFFVAPSMHGSWSPAVCYCVPGNEGVWAAAVFTVQGSAF